MAEIIEGFAELERKLKELEFTVQRKLLIEAAKAGAKIVVDEAKKMAPRDTGALAEGIAMRVAGRESDIHEGVVEVSYNKRQFYGLFQEKGTRRLRAQPFLLPALEGNRDRIMSIMRDVLLRAIDKAANGGVPSL